MSVSPKCTVVGGRGKGRGESGEGGGGQGEGGGGGGRRKFAELNKTRCLEQTKGSVDIGRIVLF